VAQPDTAARLTREGRTPSQLRVDLNKANPLTLDTVLGYLARAIGDGQIRWSDVFFNIHNRAGQQIEPFLEQHPDTASWEIRAHLDAEGIHLDSDDLDIHLRLRRERVAWGDLYARLAHLEKTLHDRIRATLVGRFGSEHDNWWYNGVPKRVREKCTAARVESEERPLLSPYYYTSFGDLTRIIDDQWAVFERALPSSVASNRRDLIDSLEHVRKIRNRTMHPVQSGPPSQKDLELVRGVRDRLAESPWRFSSP